jgi:flagellar hook-associated protein 3 FlgL
MGGSLSSVYNQISYSLALHSEAMSKLQEQASTGARINRVSDEPSSAYRLLGLHGQDKSLQTYIDNVSEIMDSCEVTTTALQSMSSELQECEKLMTQISGGIYGESNRKMIADSINDHLEQLVLLANTRHINQYLFGGAKTSTPPYAVERDSNGRITSVTYQGSEQQRQIETGPGVETSVFLVGDDTLASNARRAPEFILGNTNAAVGSGTSSVTGATWLTVTQGSDARHFLLSIDGGTTTTEVDLDDPPADVSNVAVTNSQGQVLYVNATGITSTGTDLVSVKGTFDAFQTLITIRDLLKNTHSLSETQLTEVLPKTIAWVTETNELVIQSEISVGSRTSFLESLRESLQNIQANTQDESTLLEQTDIAQVATDLSRRQTLYQMSLNVAAKLLSVSLLDYLK